jgi:hypothetical protein
MNGSGGKLRRLRRTRNQAVAEPRFINASCTTESSRAAESPVDRAPAIRWQEPSKGLVLSRPSRWACPARGQRGRAPMSEARGRPRAGRALAVCFADANATEYRGCAAASDVLRGFHPRSARTASRPSARLRYMSWPGRIVDSDRIPDAGPPCGQCSGSSTLFYPEE